MDSGLAPRGAPRNESANLPYSISNCEKKQMVKISKFDAADYLKTPEAIAAYLTEAFATDDAAYICTALDTIARAKGMTSVAKETGLSRESLYKSFSGSSKPEFDTVRKVINSFGVRLVAEPNRD
jgi:probable addiction module antidote protein